jgi:TolB-like protein/DNA-binding winged helix-turn-helix (wHTH) protein/Tfp pilus assembly protein PilF
MSTTVTVPRVFRFDNFELDIRAGELRKRGVRLRLQGQPIQVLGILLQSAGNMVTREELKSQLWPADTFVDFDHGLHNSIGRIREVLGDSADAPRYIETLPRRGYRFIGQVEGVPLPPVIPAGNGHKTVEVAAVPVPAPAKRHARFRLAWILCACSVLGVAGWLAWHHYAKSAAPPIRSIAVLPLQNLSGDPAQDYFADGMTEELITELSRIRALRVISRTSIMGYKDTKKHLPQIARELGVDGILEGSVVRDGDQVRITVQLLDGPNDRHIWSEDYQREMRGILTLQREIAQAITQQVRIQVTPQQQAGLRSSRSVDPDAYVAYLKGRTLITSDYLTAQDLRTAQHYFEEAIQRDPNFALGYVGLADCYVYLTLFNQLSPEEAHGRADEALRKALELDDSSGEAHATLALMKWRQEWDWAGAEREFNNAVALSPNFGCGHLNRSFFLSWKGQQAEALAELAKSRELDPGYSFAASEAWIYYQSREYERLIEVSRKALASDPAEWFGHYFLGVGYEGSGKRLEAIPEYQKAVEMSGGDQDPTAALAHAYAASGNKAKAEKILRDLEQKSKSSYVSPYLMATIYSGLGNKDQAFGYLERAYQQRAWDVAWQMNADLRLDDLRSDARFQELVRRAGLPQADLRTSRTP